MLFQPGGCVHWVELVEQSKNETCIQFTPVNSSAPWRVVARITDISCTLLAAGEEYTPRLADRSHLGMSVSQFEMLHGKLPSLRVWLVRMLLRRPSVKIRSETTLQLRAVSYEGARFITSGNCGATERAVWVTPLHRQLSHPREWLDFPATLVHGDNKILLGAVASDYAAILTRASGLRTLYGLWCLALDRGDQLHTMLFGQHMLGRKELAKISQAIDDSQVPR